VVEPMLRVEWILQGAQGSRIAVRRIYSSLSYVQVLRIDPSLEGAPTKHNLMGPDDGYGSEYIPH
jgi:hypothetical protein